MARLTLDERLAKKCPQTGNPDVCIIWNGATTQGYGTAAGPKGPVYVHRYVWETAYGAIPKGMVIRHLCHNRRCVNILHLRLGTVQENANDTVAIKTKSKQDFLQDKLYRSI